MKEHSRFEPLLLVLFILGLGVFNALGQGQSSNNLPGDALLLKPGQAVQDSISKAGETHYFLLPVDTSGIVSISVDGVPADMRPYIKLRNEYYFLWGSSEIGDKTATNAGDSLTLEKGLLGPSGYLIAVSDADGKAHNTPYSLKADFKPAPDANEPNNDIGDATEIKLNEPVTGYICPGDDKDVYKLYMDSPGVVVLKVDGVPEDMRPYIMIRDKNNRQIADKSATNPGDSLTLENDLGTGWNYFAVTDADGKAHSEPYTLAVTTKSEAAGIK